MLPAPLTVGLSALGLVFLAIGVRWPEFSPGSRGLQRSIEVSNCTRRVRLNCMLWNSI